MLFSLSLPSNHFLTSPTYNKIGQHPGGSDGKASVYSLSTVRETGVRALGWDDPLEKEMAIHSSILAWKIPWMEKPVGYSLWGHKET